MGAMKNMAQQMADKTGVTMETYLENQQQAVAVPAKRSIYNIENEYLELMNQIADMDGEITEEMAEALSINKEELQTKAVSYGYRMMQCRNTKQQIKDEQARLQKLLDREEKLEEKLKATVSEAMQKYGIEKVECPFLKLSHKKSEVLIIQDETNVPSGYLKTKETVTIDKAGLKKAVKAGLQFEGIWIQENMNLQIS